MSENDINGRGVFIIVTRRVEEDSNGRDWETWVFDGEDDRPVYYTTRGAAQAVIDASARREREGQYVSAVRIIEASNEKTSRANREKAALEEAGLTYTQGFGFDARRPGPLKAVPTLEEWMASAPEPGQRVHSLAESR